MQGVPDYFDCPSDRAEFRAVAGRAGVELYRAHIVHHTFEPHTHDAYGFGVIEQGVERFRYKGSDHLAPSDSIVFMHPDVLHTGRAETDGGWRYRMIYIDPTVLADIAGDAGWWFDETVVERDRPRAKHLTRLLKALWQVQDPLVFDGLLSQLVEGLSPYARRQSSAQHQSERRFANVIDYMQAHLGERIVLEDLASVAGLSPFHFLRQFQAQYHVTPHQMLMARRLYAAKQWLAQGVAPAQVAAQAGLTDQSHLTRAFTQRYGVTPGRYQAQVTR
ncbi:AraC family ligand binding domain-containing protein [Candidatus Aalborgicola defluviihabitans]|jgi:AraC-like DNA-binding protein|uniref:AraC family transcriptional regulator n=1 Tax=Candidatus Aalborgicola defluviihabitans TaxID=3386187 RepID=UPI001D691B96|nr:AraC family transcriptional regulator [Burkholderiales bacterium]MBK6569600.1 AraC family transcriptional regulator [Burkholderiales bacterium]MBK7281375.1 AraC family transcriptional regulator [Burkholderiales bacterium]MBK7315700.1 AraC family transcriptional regulator [Burkholderiales bacterium]MBL0243131.1 AraC family transcriptional regulator [Rhodoferax sp.]